MLSSTSSGRIIRATERRGGGPCATARPGSKSEMTTRSSELSEVLGLDDAMGGPVTAEEVNSYELMGSQSCGWEVGNEGDERLRSEESRQRGGHFAHATYRYVGKIALRGVFPNDAYS